MLFRKTMVKFMVFLIIIGQSVAVSAGCIDDWLMNTPPQGALTSQQITDINTIYDWLERAFPDFVSPHAESVVYDFLSFRYYSDTNVILAAVQSYQTKIVYIGPLSNQCVLEIGTVDQVMALVPKPVTDQISGVINESEYSEAESLTRITLSSMPNTLDEFLALQNQIASTPQGGVAMMILAMRIYQKDAIVGRMCLSAASTDPLISDSTAEGSYDGKIINSASISRLTENMKSYPFLPLIYFKGASPTNSYTPSGHPYVLNMFTNPYSYASGGDGLVRIKLFVETLGADSARPATVKKVCGIYKITEYSSLYLSPKAVLH
ncbi:MAG: hypothetical protein HQK70_02165 [Desulfamplus sp.]|nr:hypothetical protein [Desulfamplus sp.]